MYKIIELTLFICVAGLVIEKAAAQVGTDLGWQNVPQQPGVFDEGFYTNLFTGFLDHFMGFTPKEFAVFILKILVFWTLK